MRLLSFSALFLAIPSFAADPLKGIDFAHDVVPILKARCAKCHTNGTYKGSVSFDTRADVLKKAAVAGKARESELFRRISSDDPDTRMPPKSDPLPAKEVKVLEAWINEGLAWEPGFSFKPKVYLAPLKPRRPAIPPSSLGRDHPIDRLVGAYLAERKIAVPASLDDAAFVRRAYLDLIGLLPAPGELDAFLACTANDKLAALVRRVLDEKRECVDHWLAFLNDMVRNEHKGTGYIDGGRKQITAWLYKSLLDNKPCDQFARELINPTSESEGFARGIKWRGQVNASQ